MSSMMDAPMIELMSAMASYQVHRALLASRSSFFDGACRNPFQEAQTGTIDLTEDDPEAVEHMVHYFYHLDYLRKPLSRRSSQRSTGARSPRSPRRTTKKLNLALVEDPLVAMANAANTSMPPTPPAEPRERVDSFNSSLDLSSKLPLSPIADQYTEDPFESVVVEPETDVETPHLITHAKVYAIAEKYGISGLKTLARKKFAREMETHIDSEDLPEACQEAYETTVDTDRGLRDVIIQTFRSNPELSLRKDVEMVVRDTPGLAFELFRMASGLPVSS